MDWLLSFLDRQPSKVLRGSILELLLTIFVKRWALKLRWFNLLRSRWITICEASAIWLLSWSRKWRSWLILGVRKRCWRSDSLGWGSETVTQPWLHWLTRVHMRNLWLLFSRRLCLIITRRRVLTCCFHKDFLSKFKVPLTFLKS